VPQRVDAKSRTGREISCQPQTGGGERDATVRKRERERERERERDRDRDRDREEASAGRIRIVMRAGVVETVKEGNSKAPSFSRDLCEIPARCRV